MESCNLFVHQFTCDCKEGSYDEKNDNGQIEVKALKGPQDEQRTRKQVRLKKQFDIILKVVWNSFIIGS